MHILHFVCKYLKDFGFVFLVVCTSARVRALTSGKKAESSLYFSVSLLL